MTTMEARKYLGLRENDTIYKEGLESVQNSLSKLANTTASSTERANAIKGIQACEILLKEVK